MLFQLVQLFVSLLTAEKQMALADAIRRANADADEAERKKFSRPQ